MSIVEFLLARIAEDKAWIAGDGGSYLDDCQECAFGQQPDSPYSRARILAECEAKSRIVEWHNPTTPLGKSQPLSCLPDYELFPCRTLRLLALPYVDHSDYREEWRP